MICTTTAEAKALRQRLIQARDRLARLERDDANAIAADRARLEHEADRLRFARLAIVRRIWGCVA